jgi:hypothetical protein
MEEDKERGRHLAAIARMGGGALAAQMRRADLETLTVVRQNFATAGSPYTKASLAKVLGKGLAHKSLRPEHLAELTPAIRRFLETGRAERTFPSQFANAFAEGLTGEHLLALGEAFPAYAQTRAATRDPVEFLDVLLDGIQGGALTPERLRAVAPHLLASAREDADPRFLLYTIRHGLRKEIIKDEGLAELAGDLRVAIDDSHRREHTDFVESALEKMFARGLSHAHLRHIARALAENVRHNRDATPLANALADRIRDASFNRARLDHLTPFLAERAAKGHDDAGLVEWLSSPRRSTTSAELKSLLRHVEFAQERGRAWSPLALLESALGADEMIRDLEKTLALQREIIERSGGKFLPTKKLILDYWRAKE